MTQTIQFLRAYIATKKNDERGVFDGSVAMTVLIVLLVLLAIVALVLYIDNKRTGR